MIETLMEWDEALFLWLNGLHTSWLDPVMFWISEKKNMDPIVPIDHWVDHKRVSMAIHYRAGRYYFGHHCH